MSSQSSSASSTSSQCSQQSKHIRSEAKRERLRKKYVSLIDELASKQHELTDPKSLHAMKDYIKKVLRQFINFEFNHG